MSDLWTPDNDDGDYVLGQLAPPKYLLADWPGGTGPCVINQQYCTTHPHNEGQMVHPHLEEVLTKGPFIAMHYAQRYVGLLWYDPDDRRFYEQVDINGEFTDTGSDTNMHRLVKDIRDNYGTD